MTSVLVSTSAERRRDKLEGGFIDFQGSTRGSLFRKSTGRAAQQKLTFKALDFNGFKIIKRQHIAMIADVSDALQSKMIFEGEKR